MAGTDLRAGTGTQPDKVLTTDGDGNVGNGLGEYKALQRGLVIADVDTLTAAFSVDLKPFFSSRDQAVYKVYAHIYHPGIDKHRYAEFIIFPNTLYSDKVLSVEQTDNSTWSIDSNCILSRNGGGNRLYRVRIERIM